MEAHCPSCNAEIAPDAPSCPLCMRERSRAEIFASLRGEKPPRQKAEKKSGFGGFLVMLLGIGVMVYGVHLYLSGRALGIKADKLRAAAPGKRAADEVEEKDGRGASRRETGTTRTGAKPAKAGPAEVSEFWEVSGRVYDLISLKPVRGVRLSFTEKNSGERVRAKTDAKGRYKARLPKVESGGYDLTIRHKLYRGAFLEDMQPPFHRQIKDKRLEALSTFTESAILHVPLLPPAEENKIDYDLVLLPPG